MIGRVKKKIICGLLTASVIFCGMGSIICGIHSVTAEINDNKALSVSNCFTIDKTVTLKEQVESPYYATNGYTIYNLGGEYGTGGYEIKDRFFVRYRDKETEQEKNIKETVEYVPERFESGLQATFTKSGDSITFNSIIDFSKVTKETPLIEFIPVSKTRGLADITSISVTLEDIENSNHYVKITFQTGQHSNRTSINVATEKFSAIGYAQGGYISGQMPNLSSEGYTTYPFSLGNTGGNLQVHEMCEGATEDSFNYSPYALCIDPSNNYMVSMDNAYRSHIRNVGYEKYGDILEIANEEHVGEGNAFEGFTNNRAKMTITANTINATSGNILIYSINGYEIGGAEVLDETAPDLEVILPDKNPPKAIPNKEYKFFEFIGTDDLEGQCTTHIYLKEPNGLNFVRQTGSSFIPTQEGTYTIRYEAVDGVGNIAVKDIFVECSWTVNRLEILSESLQEICVIGEEVSIPDYIVIGGAGGIESNYNVYRVADGGEVLIENGKFIPTVAGDYEIRYFAKDYLGDTINSSLFISAQSSQKPATYGSLNITRTLIDGQTIKLPTITAYDYESMVGVNQNAGLNITVEGNGQTEILSEDRLFKADLNKFGENIKITYKYFCKEYPDSEGVVYTFDCKIKKAQYAADYFDYSEESFNVAYNAQNEQDKMYVRFEAKKVADEAKINFINAIPASNATINFEVERRNQTFEALRFTFTDRDNADVYFTVDVKKGDATNSIAAHGGKEYRFKGGFNNDQNQNTTPLGIGYVRGELVNRSGNKICSVRNADGSAFEGFPSGYCKISVSFINGTANSGVNITKIRKQNLYATYNSDGVMQPMKDIVRPDIIFSVDLVRQYKIGEEFVIPTGYASDELTAYMETRVTVTNPDGVNIIDNELQTEGRRFEITQYGNYVVKYSTVDAAGQTSNATVCKFDLNISDLIPPTITLLNPNTITAKKNEKITLPQAVVLDNIDIDISYQVVIQSKNTAERYIVDLEEDITLKVGEYTVIYYAVDKNYNVATAELKLIVED